ncbi:MAG: hypothetical protein ORO03_10380 [Alphaproteobacteria bacterium]|nr:hypothetical protein [Alphaproteobacteria bacterium]
MTRKLLSTVAFASILSSTAVYAADAPLTVKFSGFLDSYIQAVQETYPEDQTVVGNTANSTAMVGRLRLRINPDATTNGINYGAYLRINAANSGKFGYDRAYGYIGTADIGTLTIGRAGYLGYAVSSNTIYGSNGSLSGSGPDAGAITQKSLTGGAGTGSGLVGGVDRANTIAGSYVDSSGVLGNGWNRFNYETPTLSGAKLGISYTPRSNNAKLVDWDNVRDLTTLGYKDVVELAAKYNINLDGLDMTVAAGYVAGSAAKSGGESGRDRSLRNMRSFGASYTVKYMGVVANIHVANGGTTHVLSDDGYFAANPTATVAPTAPRTIGGVFNLGYESGKAAGDFSVGGYYGKGQSAGRTVSMQDPTRYTTAKVTQYGVGAQVIVVPGLSVFLAGDHIEAFSDNLRATNTNVDRSDGGWTDKASMVTLGATVAF